MSLIFEVVDKTGRKIRLTKERWSHISSQISPHAYMTNYLGEIKETLTKPDKIVRSATDENKTNYYKYYKYRKSENKLLKIIVKYLNGDGFVISSYFVRKISQ
ncbi:hypothetical protein J4462_00115 [Candidatus Pacearchaeota archaeon]|nr:hypothetical protein [Candidatus Pacearchaeota archaeon]